MCLFKSKAKTIQIKFGVPFFDVFDYRFSDVSAPVAVRGELLFHVKNYKKFLKRNGFDGINWEDFQNMIKGAVTRYVKDFVANAPMRYGIPVVQLERKTAEISDLVKAELSVRLKREFKIELYAVDITTIEVDKTAVGYKKLKEVTADIETEKILTVAEMEREEIRARSRLEIEDEEERRQRSGNKKRVRVWVVLLCWAIGLAIVAFLVSLIIKMFI